MSNARRLFWLLPALLVCLLASCDTRESIDPTDSGDNNNDGGDDTSDEPYAFLAAEESFDAQYAATPIGLTGRVVDESGAALSGVSVSLVAWGDAAGIIAAPALSDADGVFLFSGLLRRSLLLHLELAGYYDELVAADLERPLGEISTDAGSVVLVARRPGLVRFLFGGDVMFGRRYLDADEDGVLGEEDDVIHPGTEGEDAKAVLQFMREVLSASDYTQVNLESPILDDPATPHPKKEFVFHSHPDTLTALPYAGIDGVSLGNNHIYDYLEQGMFDTIQNVSASGVDWFGAGMSETEARATLMYRTLGGLDFAMQGFNSVLPINVDGWTEEDLYVAMDSPIVKGGSLYLTTQNLVSFLAASAPSYFAVPVMHGGLEYGEYPHPNMRAKAILAFESAAPLVVSHHSHTLYGIATWSDDPSRIARHIGHISTYLPPQADPGDPADGLVGAVVFPDFNRIVVANDPSEYDVADSSEILALEVAGGLTAPIPFARQSGADSLARVRTTAPAACDYGRELMHYGDFEDFDVDDAFHEGRLWNQSEVRFVENSVVRSGIGAIALLRRDTSVGAVGTWMRNRITFPPDTDLTVTGYLKGDNAGPVEIEVRWYVRDERTIISTTTEYTRAAGTYDWEPFVIDLTPPSEAGTIRVYFRHHPPLSGQGTLFVDDVATIQWEASVADAAPGFDLPTPNNWSWLRFQPQDPGLTTLGVTLTHRVYSLRPDSL